MRPDWSRKAWSCAGSLAINGGLAFRSAFWAGRHTRGDWKRAIARLGESLEVRREIGDKSGCAWCLERLSEVALGQRQAEKAVRLLAAAAALRLSIGSVIDPVDRTEYERMRGSLRSQLSEQRFTAAWDEGRRLTLEQAVAYALES